MKRRWKISYQDRLWMCFIIGVTVGTVIANLLCGELQSQAGYLYSLLGARQDLGSGEQYRLWLFVVRQRVLELLGAWLIGLTVFAAAGYYVLAVAAGGSVALVLSVVTMQKGVLGLPFYLVTVMPQACCYLPVCLILASWAGDGSRKIRLGGTGVLLMLAAAGAAAEVYINPLLMGVL